jgi:hypothetical protein
MSVRRTAIAGYLILVALSLGAALRAPIAIQKINAIVPAQGFAPIDGEGSLDVAEVVRSIPYRPQPVWTVEPSQKYQQTIVEGFGNCSQKTFGLAYLLDQSGIDYQVIHFLPPDRFLVGGGHTVMRTRYHYQGIERVGIVDLLEAGLPVSASGYADIDTLAAGPLADFRFELLNSETDGISNFYGDFLHEAVLAYIPASEIAGYFRFLEAVYVPLGSERLEKHFYDGLALMLGFYPAIHVPDYERLVEGREVEWLTYRSALWVLRSALVGLPLLTLAALLGWRRRRSA